MLKSCTRKLFFLFVTLVFTLSVKAQKPHFIYLQTDNGLPFYTKFNGKLISSSAEGYVILSGVIDGEYQITIGFPKNELPEATFKITMDNQNEGFLLKNFDDKGLQLFNLQTLALIQPTRANTVTVNTKKDEDAFSVALAGAVKDSSILQNHENTGEPSAKKPVTAASVNTGSSQTKNNLAIDSNATSSQTTALNAKENSSISKISDIRNQEGSRMIYADKDSAGTDTINVLMPVKNNPTGSNEPKNVAAQKDTLNQAPLAVTPTVAATESNSGVVSGESNVSKETKINQDSSINTITPATSNAVSSSNILQTDTTTNTKAEQVNKTSEDGNAASPKEVTASRINSDCKNFATDNDFLNLRKKMAEESESDKMIRVAKKYFKSKCYTTAQIKNLSYIFLTNESKYQFFEAAYPFVSDSNQYQTLENQFTDPYYLNRFKALVGQ